MGASAISIIASRTVYLHHPPNTTHPDILTRKPPNRPKWLTGKLTPSTAVCTPGDGSVEGDMLTKSSTLFPPLSRWSIFVGLFVIAAMCVAAWFLSPKGENQVLVLHHSDLGTQGSTPSRLSVLWLFATLTALLSLTFGRLWRSSLILAFVCCYLMWAITFLAQLHPLIEPKRSDLREKFVHE